MTWSADLAIQCQNLLTQIDTRLTASGWTLYDNVSATDKVYTSTNNQGAANVVEIKLVGSYQYLQFIGWQSWNSGTHAGTNGSDTNAARLYFASAAIGGTVTVDLHMSVTANRFFISVTCASQNYRNWAYFGGLGSAAASSDTKCVCLITSHMYGSSSNPGLVMQWVGDTSSWWQRAALGTIGLIGTSDAEGGQYSAFHSNPVMSDGGKPAIFPIYWIDWQSSQSGTAQYGPMRGDLDGVYFAPGGQGAFGHGDTVTISGTTYLLIVPGGRVSGAMHPITGNYVGGLAIAES